MGFYSPSFLAFIVCSYSCSSFFIFYFYLIFHNLLRFHYLENTHSCLNNTKYTSDSIHFLMFLISSDKCFIIIYEQKKKYIDYYCKLLPDCYAKLFSYLYSNIGLIKLKLLIGFCFSLLQWYSRGCCMLPNRYIGPCAETVHNDSWLFIALQAIRNRYNDGTTCSQLRRKRRKLW